MPDDGQQEGRFFTITGENATPTRGASTEPLILVSNRGPLEFSFDDDGGVEPRRGAGGVVSGLLCAVQHRPVTWIALAMTDADREAARQPFCPLPGLEHVTLRMVDVPPRVYGRYYNGISNSVLWFAQHYLLELHRNTETDEHFERDWETGYRAVNERVAEEVIAALATDTQTPVIFQDYHLYLAPARVRARYPQARLGHFVHIPWPDARYWEMLPEAMVRAIFEGLAACDTVGFQTARDAHNFLLGAERFLAGARVEWDRTGAGTLQVAGRRVAARAFPIAVTPDEVLRCAKSLGPLGQAVELSQQLRLGPDHKLIVRVDRIEPTKNIVRGFQAYERLLRDHPELHGQVTFLALLVPTRQGMTQYQAYERQVRGLIERVNTRFGQPGWQPIVAIYGNNRARALACMHRYDVLLVNPLIDGMNLVVKEGGLLNRRSGVIVLSRTAGAYEQLSEHVQGVPPLDIRATAEALYQALHLPIRERMERAQAIRAVLSAEDATSWLDAQVASLPARGASRRDRAGVRPVPVLTALDTASGRRVPIPLRRDEQVISVTRAALGNLAAMDGSLDVVESTETLNDLGGLEGIDDLSDHIALP